MLSIEEAQGRILSAIKRMPVAEVPLLGARGLVLAEDAIASDPIPTFAASAMDGYAVRAEDVAMASGATPAILRVVGESAAGSAFGGSVGAGEAVRISTGAPVPPGSDAVVMQEVTRRDGGFVQVMEPVASGRHIRPVGNDVRAGTLVLQAGRTLNPAAIGMLAAMGFSSVRVYRRPRVGILSTGDELAVPGRPLGQGQIYDSNRIALQAQVEESGAEVISSVHAPDREDAIREALAMFEGCDIIISSGGVSVGDHDLVKPILAEGGDIDFWRVAIKPGKPLAFGQYRGIPFFGLPGNPVSAYVTFEVFVRPALRRMLGHPGDFQSLPAILDERVEHELGRREFVRARVRFVDGAYHVRPVGDQDSAVMSAMARANALLIVPENIRWLEPGQMVYTLMLQEHITEP